jgi:hypothetical protein
VALLVKTAKKGGGGTLRPANGGSPSIADILPFFRPFPQPPISKATGTRDQAPPTQSAGFSDH